MKSTPQTDTSVEQPSTEMPLRAKIRRFFLSDFDADKVLGVYVRLSLLLIPLAILGYFIFSNYLYRRFQSAVRRGDVDMAAWGQLGDFLGGLLNPSLAFITIIGLFVTISVQMWTLRLSIQANRKADELSRLQTEHSYYAARLNALTTMIQAAKHEIETMKQLGWSANTTKINEVEGKISKWNRQLEETSAKLEEAAPSNAPLK